MENRFMNEKTVYIYIDSTRGTINEDAVCFVRFVQNRIKRKKIYGVTTEPISQWNGLKKDELDKVIMPEYFLSNTYDTKLYAQFLSYITMKYGEGIFIFPSGNIGDDLAARLAAMKEVIPLSDVAHLTENANGIYVTRPDNHDNEVFEYKIKENGISVISLKYILNEKQDYKAKRSISIEKINYQNEDVKEKIILIKKEKINETKIREKIEKSNRLLGCGRGFGTRNELKQVKELAGKLDAQLCVTRPLVDMGVAPKEIQVGLSGKTVSPEFYLAIGVSGSMQHLAGLKNIQYILAINIDRNAPIFDYANFGIVGDAHILIPMINNILNSKKKIEANDSVK